MNAQDAATRERNPDDRIFNGLEFAVLEIEDALKIATASIKVLRENQDGRHMVGIKLASEQIAKVSRQIDGLSSSLARTAETHINRRPR